MQLALRRSQQEQTDRKGRSTVTFHLAYQLRTSPEERAVIERYGLAPRYVMGDHTSGSDVSQTVQKLIDGSSYSWSSTDLVLMHEKLVLKAARNAAALVSQVAAFDGTETIIELTPSSDTDSE